MADDEVKTTDLAPQPQKSKRGRKTKWTEEERALRDRQWAEKRAIKQAAEEIHYLYHPEEPRPKKRTGAQNLGVGESEEDKEMISKIVTQAVAAFRMPQCRNDEELEQRIDRYFVGCANSGTIPTVEELYMYLGYAPSTVSQIRNGTSPGFSPNTRHILDAAANMMGTIDAKMAMTGKVRDAIYIFRSKNYHGMSDNKEITVSAAPRDEKQMSKEDLEKWFEAENVVETTFKEDET